jgi:hypothetical protein
MAHGKPFSFCAAKNEVKYLTSCYLAGSEVSCPSEVWYKKPEIFFNRQLSTSSNHSTSSVNDLPTSGTCKTSKRIYGHGSRKLNPSAGNYFLPYGNYKTFANNYFLAAYLNR